MSQDNDQGSHVVRVSEAGGRHSVQYKIHSLGKSVHDGHDKVNDDDGEQHKSCPLPIVIAVLASLCSLYRCLSALSECQEEVSCSDLCLCLKEKSHRVW